MTRTRSISCVSCGPSTPRRSPHGLLRLADQELSAAVTADAMSRLGALFGGPEAVGISMAVRAAGPDAVADVVSASFTALVSDSSDRNRRKANAGRTAIPWGRHLTTSAK